MDLLVLTALGIAVLLFVFNRVGEVKTVQRGGFGTGPTAILVGAIVGGIAIFALLLRFGLVP